MTCMSPSAGQILRVPRTHSQLAFLLAHKPWTVAPQNETETGVFVRRRLEIVPFRGFQFNHPPH